MKGFNSSIMIFSKNIFKINIDNQHQKHNSIKHKNLFKKFAVATFSTLLSSALALTHICTVFATEDLEAQREARKYLPVQTDEIANWPEGPAIGAECAILMEMNTHTILYAKNIHEKMYPASITKIMTCLLAAQNCSMDEKVTFSHDAIYSVPADGSNMGMREGNSITLEQALYGVLVKSANEVAAAVGEHVAGAMGKEATTEAFAEIMNEKAKALGCQDTNFVNANGLYDENHYTSAYDMALIGCEFFDNEMLCRMSSTSSYHIEPTATQPEDVWMSSKNQLYEGKPYEYEYLLGSKTGFVSQSRQTLVSGAEKDGMKLVCVIMMEESPYQFEDTVTLFNYGFENFHKLSIAENETKYNVNQFDSFSTGDDLFGDSTQLMTMDDDSYVILPNTAEFSDTVSTLNYSDSTENGVVATIDYTYSDVPVGSCDIMFSKEQAQEFDFNSGTGNSETNTMTNNNESASINVNDKNSDDTNIIFVNIKKILTGIVIVAVIVILSLTLMSFISSYNFSPKGQSNKRRRKLSRTTKAAKRAARIDMIRDRYKQKKRRKAYKKRHSDSRRRRR